MSYATRDDLAARFGEDELIAITTGAVGGRADEDRLALALADAGGEIDAYLAGRYALPLAGRPPLLVGLEADIARYRLYDEAASETVRARYEDAVQLLRAIARGDVLLGSAPTARPGAPAVGSRELCLTDEWFARTSPFGAPCGCPGVFPR